METRATKVFLPTSYQEYLAQKKKLNRLNNTNKLSVSNHDNLSNNNQSSKEYHLSSNFQSSRTKKQSIIINQNDSPLNNNFFSSFNLPPNILSSNTNTKPLYEKSEHNSDTQGAQNINPNNKKQTRIIQKIVYSEYKTLFEEFQNSKFENIKRKIQQQLKKLQQSTQLEPIKVNEILKKFQLQSLENIIEIQKQLKHPFGKRNPQKLDSMLNFNKFFVILNKEKRYRIYQNSTLKKYQPGEIVYKQGDINQHMYVVIKGCVKQYETKSTSYQDKVEVNFVSYYEGSNFGQAPLVGNTQMKEKRYNTTMTTEEKAYLLQLANNFYKELITNSAEDDFERKIQALMETSIFRDTSKIYVTPLLPTLTKHVLNYGTVLIRQGQQVRNFYFVAEGNLQVMLLDRAKRTVKHLNIQQKPKNFYTKRTQLSSSQNKSRAASTQKKKSYSIHTKFYYPENTEKQSKEFLYGNKKLIGDNQMEYNEQIVFQTLRMGDFFGGKSFLQQIEREKKMANSQYFDTSLKARLSVLSSSPKTIVYSLDEKKFFSLSDNFQKMITQGIIEAKYFDEYDIQQKVSQQKDWKKYSQKIVSNVISAKKNSRSTSFRM